jgi:polysaccharide biosynthesis/export protein
MKKRFLTVAVVAAAVASCLVPAAPTHGQDTSPIPTSLENGEYRIGPEDVLQIVVWKNDTLSRSVAVLPDGKIALPLIAEVQAAGLTTNELRDALSKRLAEYVMSPEVSVIVTDVRSMKVSVIGEVPKPGRYELRSRTTVLDVLALAGGFSQFASRSRIVVLRPEGEKMKRIPFNYNRLASGGEADNFYLRPGDIVVVP